MPAGCQVLVVVRGAWTVVPVVWLVRWWDSSKIQYESKNTANTVLYIRPHTLTQRSNLQTAALPRGGDWHAQTKTRYVL